MRCYWFDQAAGESDICTVRMTEVTSPIPKFRMVISAAQGPLVLGRKCLRRFRWLSARAAHRTKVMSEEPPPAAESPEVA
jgi:hypothetical protein